MYGVPPLRRPSPQQHPQHIVVIGSEGMSANIPPHQARPTPASSRPLNRPGSDMSDHANYNTGRSDYAPSVHSNPSSSGPGPGLGPGPGPGSGPQYRVSGPPNYYGDNEAYESYYADRQQGTRSSQSSGSGGGRRPPPAPSSGQQHSSGSAPMRVASAGDQDHPNQNRVPTPYTPRARSEQYLYSRFGEFDSRNIGLLSEADLATGLRNGDNTRFDPTTVHLIVRMFDEDGDHAINFQEFKKLWSYLYDYREIFNQFDRDASGDINLSEFQRALRSFGYRLSGPCIKTIFAKYSRSSRSRREHVISFDKFVLACIHLLNITQSFKRFDYNRDGYATIGFEDYLVEVTMLR